MNQPFHFSKKLTNNNIYYCAHLNLHIGRYPFVLTLCSVYLSINTYMCMYVRLSSVHFVYTSPTEILNFKLKSETHKIGKDPQIGARKWFKLAWLRIPSIVI